MKTWYSNITKAQKTFLFTISVLLILVYGIGLIPLALLTYLQLGQPNPNQL
ncbi:hypothetical protein R75471_00057 [Paraburkholderia domus]|uniref:hypothetical protein n=1 Tax=Paraburkholderia domus TaxID=2793075 RepID=UPI001B1EEB61|nr:hypothetical protein [Paraburkholderia domus]CAE6858839.1 hypothetical protein R75471_00057 [Paraburkholderia domus]